jgi:arylsulfatase
VLRNWQTYLLCFGFTQACTDPGAETLNRLHLPPIELEIGPTAPLGLIVITVDTLRADYLSCYGNPKALTPSFDRLAAEGQLFKNAFSQSTTTTPSHASLFTSLYLQDHNVYSNFEALGNKPRTMAEYFYGRGFATFGIVNMRHLNPEVGNLGQGFETFVRSGFLRRAKTSIDEFLKWQDSLGEQPFFSWIHLADVHTPYRPPPPYTHFYYDDDERDPQKQSLGKVWSLLPDHMSDHPFFRSWLDGITDLDWVYAQYQGAVSYVDAQIGRLLGELEDRDLLHRVAIVLTSDHGEALGEHDMYFVHTGLYEPTVHVPLITYFPGSQRQGVMINEVTELVDVLPTVLDYFGVGRPTNIRGHSLWPLIKGQIQPKKVAFIEHAGHNLVALRSDRYKYIQHLRDLHIQPSYPFQRGREELYDLRLDPSEQNDISKTQPAVLSVLRQELQRRRQGRFDLSTGVADINEETINVLRSLGYVD